jgi:cell division protein FtsB
MPRGTLRYNTKKEKVYIALLTILLLVLARGVWILYVKHRIATSEQITIEQKLLQAEKRLDDLSQEVVNLETDRGIEESIRTKFNVAKPGEKTVVLVAPATSTSVVENKSLWDKIQSFFFGSLTEEKKN